MPRDPAKTSTTVAKQELLAFGRIILRQAFGRTGIPDPVFHPDQKLDTGPFRFWLNAAGLKPGEPAKATISIPKGRLLRETPEELFPELLDVYTIYSLFLEGAKDLTANNPAFADRRAHFGATCSPTLVGLQGASMFVDEEQPLLATRTPLQVWLDAKLQALPREHLELLKSRAKFLSKEDKDRRKQIVRRLVDDHGKHMMTIHKASRFPEPSNGMIGKRAAAILGEVQPDQDISEGDDDGHD